MSAVPAPRRSRGSGVAGWITGGVAAAVVVVAAVVIGAGGRGRQAAPLSPTSDERLGTSAMVALAAGLGADVATANRLPDLAAGDAPDVVVLLVDLLDAAQREALDDWVDAGGVLVVTDPASTLVPEAAADFATVDDLAPPDRLARACDIAALAGVDPAGVEPRNGGVLFDVAPGAGSCIDDGAGRAYVVAADRGRGTVVAVGGAGMMVNAALAAGSNAAAVAALVAPREGTRLLVLEPGPLAGAATGRQSLHELVPAGVWRATLQLVLAFAVYAAWRARRLGRPVPEPSPPPVAGSELVAAAGSLLDRSSSAGHAAELLRGDLRRVLAAELGVPPDVPAGDLAALAATSTGPSEADLRAALDGPPVTDDQGLAELAATIDRVLQEVRHRV